MATAGQRFNAAAFHRNAENEVPGKKIGAAAVKGRKAIATRKPLGDRENHKPLSRNPLKPTVSNIHAKKQLLTTTLKNEIAVKQKAVLKNIVDKENDVQGKEFKKEAAPIVPAPSKQEEEPVPMEVSVAKTPKVEPTNQLENAFSRMRFDVEDIDSDDHDNPFLVAEYVNDIYGYLNELEVEHAISVDYLSHNKLVTGRFRKILVDWLIQIHSRLSLLQETLYLTVMLLDRFLAVDNKVSKTDLQLTGVTCMLIASKFEEMYLPALKDFVYLGNYSFKEHDILLMEMRILDKIKFNLSLPLPLQFLRRFSKASGAATVHHTMAKYFMELSLPEYHMAHIKPSHLAASALCLAFEVNDVNQPGMHESVWSPTTQYYSGYEYSTLLPVMKDLAALVVKAADMYKQSNKAKVNTVFRKYVSAKMLQISLKAEMTGPGMKYFASLQ